MLYTYVVRAITNYILIGEYCLSFFPKKSFACPYRDYSIELRNHILYGCWYYRKCWNSKRDLLKDIITFLKFNLEAFYFHENITQQHFH